MTKSLRMLFLVLALALAPAMAFADPALLGNTSTLKQYGDDNDGLVNQAGQKNTATINQGTPTENAFNNYAQQKQYGGSYNEALIDQLGTWNDARQEQKGTHNHAKIEQTGTGTSELEINIAHQRQALHNPGSDGNKATIKQVGLGNTADQTQDGWNNSLESLVPARYGIEQRGDLNEATQIQVGSHQTGTIFQDGNSNHALQNQSCCYNTATIDQIFDDNTASQLQIGGVKNKAEIRQVGWDNEAYQTQSGNWNTAKAFQLDGACLNTSIQDQGGIGGHTSTVTQVGFHNFASVIQRGGGYVTP